MSSLLKKLNIKESSTLVILNAPLPLVKTLADPSITTTTRVSRTISCAITFVTKLDEVERFANDLTSRATDDAILWFAYPKSTSKNYQCEFNRDTGWQSLGKLGWEPVRQIAIDDDWTALRFRKRTKIPIMTRTTLRSHGTHELSPVDAYIATLPPVQQDALQRLRTIILSVIPDAEEVISYGIPTFRLQGTNVVHIGASKNHCSFYTGGTPMETFSKELEPFSTSKGTIRFQADKPLSKPLIIKLVKYRLAEIVEKRPTKRTAKSSGKKSEYDNQSKNKTTSTDSLNSSKKAKAKSNDNSSTKNSSTYQNSEHRHE